MKRLLVVLWASAVITSLGSCQTAVQSDPKDVPAASSEPAPSSGEASSGESAKIAVNGIVWDTEAPAIDYILPVGARFVRTASVTPMSATVPGVTYTSTNPAVATVDRDGIVTAVGEGTTDIVVFAQDDATIRISYSLHVAGEGPAFSEMIAESSSEAAEAKLKT